MQANDMIQAAFVLVALAIAGTNLIALFKDKAAYGVRPWAELFFVANATVYAVNMAYLGQPLTATAGVLAVCFHIVHAVAIIYYRRKQSQGEANAPRPDQHDSLGSPESLPPLRDLGTAHLARQGGGVLARDGGRPDWHDVASQM
jgi:hypothetical protein